MKSSFSSKYLKICLFSSPTQAIVYREILNFLA
jgi:hypothetical protein